MGGLPQADAMRCNRSDGPKHAVGRLVACGCRVAKLGSPCSVSPSPRPLSHQGEREKPPAARKLICITRTKGEGEIVLP